MARRIGLERRQPGGDQSFTVAFWSAAPGHLRSLAHHENRIANGPLPKDSRRSSVTERGDDFSEGVGHRAALVGWGDPFRRSIASRLPPTRPLASRCSCDHASHAPRQRAAPALIRRLRKAGDFHRWPAEHNRVACASWRIVPGCPKSRMAIARHMVKSADEEAPT